MLHAFLRNNILTNTEASQEVIAAIQGGRTMAAAVGEDSRQIHDGKETMTNGPLHPLVGNPKVVPIGAHGVRIHRVDQERRK